MLENAFPGLYNLNIFWGLRLLSCSDLYKSPSSSFGVSEIFCGPLMCWYYWSWWPLQNKKLRWNPTLFVLWYIKYQETLHFWSTLYYLSSIGGLSCILIIFIVLLFGRFIYLKLPFWILTAAIWRLLMLSCTDSSSATHRKLSQHSTWLPMRFSLRSIQTASWNTRYRWGNVSWLQLDHYREEKCVWADRKS